MTTTPKWPRLRDLPEGERQPFKVHLQGQTCPLLDGVPMAEQDAFYPWDYEDWKQGSPVSD
ncbi:MAG: hypothetical protein VW362_12450 [Candidatus Nanopelagicales bacterium]|jgi:hypothetical protein